MLNFNLQGASNDLASSRNNNDFVHGISFAMCNCRKHGEIGNALNALKQKSPGAFYFHNISLIMPVLELLIVFFSKLMGVN
jgi:hypothetical protein